MSYNKLYVNYAHEPSFSNDHGPPGGGGGSRMAGGYECGHIPTDVKLTKTVILLWGCDI